MSGSQCSYTHLYSSRFYEDCETASENFLYREEVQSTKHQKNAAKSSYGHIIIAQIRRSLSCCFGARDDEGPSLHNYGVDVTKVFDNTESQQSTPRTSRHKSDIDQAIWIIQASKDTDSISLKLSDARWIALAWVAKVANGERMTRSVVKNLVVDAQRAKNTIEAMSKTIIKNFPGLELADDVNSFETVDHAMAIDSVVDYMNEHAGLNTLSFAIIVKKGYCCALYYNSRGESSDLVLLEVMIGGKRKGSNTTRMLAYRRLTHVRDHLLDVEALKSWSTLYCYTFNIKNLCYATVGDITKYPRATFDNKNEVPDNTLEDKGGFG
uniref:Uncharacterized protein n=1 Tax=Babesia bovis TaxID=5865 RepID=S6B8F1_BABBO|nr:hypothetical protein [Babesia bovis]